MKPTRAQEAAARRLLADSGFEDLEGHDRDAPLSDRGNLHPVAETEGEQQRLRGRIEDGQAYTEWALSVLHVRRWRTALERNVWRMHCDGDGLQTTADALGISYHRARGIVEATKASRVTQGRDVKEQKKWPRDKIGRTAKLRRLSESSCLALARTLILGLKQRPCSPAPSNR